MTASPVMAVTRPVQNVGQLPGRLSAASQVLRYGDRTASGTAGGRKGEAGRTHLQQPSAFHATPVRRTQFNGIKLDRTHRTALVMIVDGLRRGEGDCEEQEPLGVAEAVAVQLAEAGHAVADRLRVHEQ